MSVSLDDIKNGKLPENEDVKETVTDTPVEQSTPTAKKVVSIADMKAAGILKEPDPELNEGELDKMIKSTMDPESLNPSLARRAAVAAEAAAKAFEENLPDPTEEDPIDATVNNTTEQPVVEEAVESSDEDDLDLYDPDFVGDYDENEEEVRSTDTMDNTPVNKNDLPPVTVQETSPVTPVDTSSIQIQTPVVTSYEEMKSNTNKINYDEDLKELLESEMVDEGKTPEESEIIVKLSADLKDKLKANKRSTEGFTVFKKPVSLNNALKVANIDKTADWALYYTGVPLSMRTFSGDEIAKIVDLFSEVNRPNQRNTMNALSQLYSTVFNHITSPKPATWEQWLKSVNFKDINNIFFTMYKASYNGTNFLTRECTECGEIFLTDNVDMQDMVEYKDETVAKHTSNIIDSKEYNSTGVFPETIVPISDSYAVGFREPNLYSTLMENEIKDQRFVEKYRDTLALLPYIETMYVIDYENQTYRPIAYKTFPNNPEKTMKAKVITYAAIINTLSSDDYYFFEEKFSDFVSDKMDEIKFQIPECTCPKCNKQIAKREMDPVSLVFMRHRLVRDSNF